MGLVKFGGGIVQVSGSIAGTTHARNRFGNYIRPRTKPVNPNTWGQSKIRSAMSYLSEWWHDELTQNQRDAWEAYATAVAMKNRLGETIHLTGFNHWIRSASNRLFNAQSMIEDAPVNFSLAEKDPSISIDCDSEPQVITVTFDLTMDWLDETGGYMHLRQGMPVKGTHNFFAGPFRHVGVILGSGTPWTTPVPFTPVIPLGLGQKCWCAFRISRLDGRLSEQFTAFATVHGSSPGEVPGLIGMTQSAAEAALAKVELILGTVTTEHSDNVPANVVISCFPVVHARLAIGDAVNIVTSLGPAPPEGGGEEPPPE